MNSTSDVEKLINVLYVGNSAKRRAAASQLVKLGDNAVEALVVALRHDEGPTRATAAWALGEIGGPRVRVPLQEASQDSDPQVRKRAVEALGKTDPIFVKLAKVLLFNPVLHVCSRGIRFALKLLSEILEILNNARLKILDSINLFFGRGVYRDTTLSPFYFECRRHVNIDEVELHSLLPNQAPCEKCGTILQKPPFGLGFVLACPQCHCAEEYARESYHAAQARLVRRALRKNKKLRQHFDVYIEREFRIYRH